MNELSTKDQIIQTAERLFAEKGFDGASMREVTSAAGVNLAAINYHFRSKEGLLDAILARRLVPVNEQRLRRLDAVLRHAGGGRPVLERIIEALVSPVLQLERDAEQGGEQFVKLV